MAQLQFEVAQYGFYNLLLDKPTKPASKKAHTVILKEVIRNRKLYHGKTIRCKRNIKNSWTKRMYIIFSMMFGNGVDGLSQNLKLSFELSGITFYVARFLVILFLVLPIMGVETFMGRYSKLTNAQMFRMAPIAYGMVVMNYIYNCLYIPFTITEVSLMLLGAIRLLIESDHMDTCLDENGKDLPGCYDYRTKGSLVNDTCTPDILSFNCEKNGHISYVAQYHFWKDYFDIYRERNSIFLTWPLMTVTSLSWVALVIIVLYGMKFLKYLFLFSSIAYFLVIFLINEMALFSDGLPMAFKELTDWQQMPTLKTIVLVISCSTINLKLTGPIGHMTSAAFLEPDDFYGSTIRMQRMFIPVLPLVIALLQLLIEACHLITMLMIACVVADTYGISNAMHVYLPNVGLYYAMVIEFFNYKKVTVTSKIVYFIVIWVQEMAKLGIVMHFNVMSILDFFPSTFNYVNTVKVTLGVIYMIIASVLVQVHIYWYVSAFHHINLCFVEPIRLGALSFIIFYVYGINRIEGDLMFHIGKSVLKYWRLIWPSFPLIYLSIFIYMIFVFLSEERVDFLSRDIPQTNRTILIYGVTASAVYLSGALGFLYLRIITLGRITSISNLLKPDFHWGPLQQQRRKQRKGYATMVNIRSTRHRTRLQRFRKNSIRQMNEQDIIEGSVRGRVFLDSKFFTNCDEYYPVRPSRPTHERTCVKPPVKIGSWRTSLVPSKVSSKIASIDGSDNSALQRSSFKTSKL